jgi:hypothetical protein
MPSRKRFYAFLERAQDSSPVFAGKRRLAEDCFPSVYYFPENSKKLKLKDNRQVEFVDMKEFPPMVNRNWKCKKVFVRECYRSFFDSFVKELKNECGFNAMVTGNPGVGKSYFYLYVIYRFLWEPELIGRRRLLINSGDDFLLLESDLFIRVIPDTRLRMDPTILRLIDGRTAPGQLTGWAATTILFASPSNNKTADKPREFMKNFEFFYYFMPAC